MQSISKHRPAEATGLERTSMAAATEVNWAKLRGEFPALANWTYLDTARKTVPPRCQEAVMRDYWNDIAETAGADAWSAVNVAETRAAMAALLGAKPAEIAFTKNTTEGLNIAAHAFDLRPGDNVVLTDMEHVANVWCVAALGCEGGRDPFRKKPRWMSAGGGFSRADG